MADSKISELTALTSPASDDVLAIVDTDAGVTKKITVSNLQSASFQFVLEDGDGTEVTINNNNEVKFVEGGGIDINWTDTDNGSDADPYDLTFSIDSTVATLTGSQTLTNKTLTSPVLNTGVSGTAVKDEDNMASDSATHLATQQSIKAYVDSTVAATNELVEDSSPQLGGDLDLNSNNITGTGNINITGGLTATAASTISVTDNSDNLTLTCTDADGSAGPNLRMYRNSSSPDDGNDLGVIDFEGRNDNSQDVVYAQIKSLITDQTDGTEDGKLELYHMFNGSLAPSLQLTSAGVVINESSNDIDFRVESNGNTHMLFVDGGNDQVQIGGNLLINGTTPTVTVGDGGAEDAKILFDGNEQNFHIGLDDSTNKLTIGLGNALGTFPGFTMDENTAVEFPDNTVTIISSGNHDMLTLKSTDADANSGPVLVLNRDSGSPADNDACGLIKFKADDDGGNSTELVNISATFTDVSNGAEDATFNISSVIGGSQMGRFTATASETVLNDDSGDIDFRVESDGDTHAFFLEASTGNIGIGTSSIDVITQAGGSGYRVLQLENNEGGQINLDHTDAGTGSTLGMINFNRAGETVAHIGGVTDGATDSGHIQFRTQPASGALTERMRITSTGLVGIGTSSPDSLITMSASVPIIKLIDSDDNSFSRVYHSAGSLFFDADKGNGVGSSKIQFGVDDTERMRIDSSGRVGIGTSSPADMLHVLGSSSTLDIGTDDSAEIVAQFNGDSTANRSGRLKIAGTNIPSNNSIAFISDSSSGVGFSFNVRGSSRKEAMAITGDGVIKHLGGTATSTSDLTTGGIHFHDTSTSAGDIMPITFTPTATADRARAGIGFISQAQDGSAGFAADIAFYTRGAADGSTLGTSDERMRINSSGYVGIGTNAPDAQLKVDTTISNYTARIRNLHGSDPFGIFIKYTSAGPDGSGNQFLLLQDNSTTRMQVLSDGDVQNHDNSYGSTSDERIKQDIRDSNSQWDDIKALKIRNYKKKDDVRQYGDNAWEQIGVVAQELETVSPKLIKHNNPDASDILSDSSFGTLWTADDPETQDAVEEVLYTADDPETQDVLYTVDDVETQDVLYTEEDELPEGVEVGDVKEPASASVGDVKTKASQNVGDVKIEAKPSTKQIGDVKEIKEQVKSVKYSVLYMKAIKALQEAMDRIETLESKVATLQGQ